MNGFTDWNTAWTKTQIAAIRQVRIIIVGRTRDAFASVGKVPVSGLYLYRRPPAATRRRRRPTIGTSAFSWRRRPPCATPP